MPSVSTNCALWVTRVLWLATTVLVPLAINGAVAGRTSMAANVAVAAWWVVAGIVVVALVVCGPSGLTTIRMLAPAAVAVTVIALVLGASALRSIPALAAASLATLSAFMAETGEACVQVSAYGDERRLPLRPPAAMQIPIVASWTLWLMITLAAVLLLAADRLLIAVPLLALAILLAWLIFVRLHRFACRWLVSVPAGVVVHDPVVLGETLMVLRPNVQHAQLALADTEAADLSGPAAGHAVEITLRAMAQVVFAATVAKPKGSAIHAQAILVAPSRPGRALRTLADRNITVVG
ncbi:hypothetical protein BH10ACT2_BH10ACT2_26550 [soil metagenome]